ncbi:MAG: DNA primase [Pseudazoarcus pumilus]|nr:DNA primase [Pseudazoarcus pumilus]
MIPRSFIQDLLARVDIVDVIERYLPLKKGGINYFACCPFHGEKTPSFSISPSKQFYHCFGCGVHGNAIGFLMEYSGLSFVEAVRELAQQVGLEVPQEQGDASHAQRSGEHEALLTAMDKATQFYRDQLKTSPEAIAYLKRRGLTGEIAARFGIGFAPAGWQSLEAVFPNYQDKTLLDAGLVIVNEQGRRYDRFRERIMFPIQDRRGRVIAFGGRVLDSGEPKYLNSPETPLFEKGRELYGIRQAMQAIRDDGYALVVEGYMDVVALAQFGIGNAVATLGTATTPHHIQSLLRYADRIVFCFDGDKAGRKAARRALENSLEALRDDATLAFLFLPEEHDPDSFVRSEGADALREAARNATPLAGFLLRELSADCDLDTAEGRARLVHEARPLVSRVAAPLLKLQLVKAVAEAGGLNQGEVEQAWGMPASHRTTVQRHDTRTPRNPRPARGKRQAPTSPAATLLRLVLQHPAWIARIPVDLVPHGEPQGQALAALCDAVSIGELETGKGLAQVVEHFRESPHYAVLAASAAELVGTDYDDSVIEQMFDDTLDSLAARNIEQEILALTAREREQGLDAGERRRLAELIAEKHRTRSPGKA